MRVVLDTNILLSALITRGTPPDALYEAWRSGRFTLVSCTEQLDELRAITRRDRVRPLISATEAGRMVNDIRDLALMVDNAPPVDASPDPADNYLLAIAAAAGADLLVTGDKRDLLDLSKHAATAIVTARDAVDRLGA